jgi:hypothetical protein
MYRPSVFCDRGYTRAAVADRNREALEAADNTEPTPRLEIR